ncbi:MAG: tyrosine-type recombinase/integrase [Clostridiales bacterium]|nr:tyrosine-type recombinase/integrase [Clostridiales bacterium]
MGKSYQDSGYIFCWEDGRPYTPDYLTKSFKKLVRANDRLDNNLTLHSLRASCVSILIHMGVDIKDVQKWVGHSGIQTTLNIYAQTNQKQQDKTMNHMVDALLSAGGSGQNS